MCIIFKLDPLLWMIPNPKTIYITDQAGPESWEPTVTPSHISKVGIPQAVTKITSYDTAATTVVPLLPLFILLYSTITDLLLQCCLCIYEQ